MHLLLATAAKVLCSAVFVSGRDEAEAVRNSAFHALQSHHLPNVFLPLAAVETDRAAGRVTVRLRLDAAAAGRIVAGYRDQYPGLPGDWEAETRRLTRLGTVARTARHLGDQGCAILRRGDDRLFFTPVPVRSALPDAAAMPWPMGDAAGPGLAAVNQAIAGALQDPDACTVAVVAGKRGLVAVLRG